MHISALTKMEALNKYLNGKDRFMILCSDKSVWMHGNKSVKEIGVTKADVNQYITTHVAPEDIRELGNLKTDYPVEYNNTDYQKTARYISEGAFYGLAFSLPLKQRTNESKAFVQSIQKAIVQFRAQGYLIADYRLDAVQKELIEKEDTVTGFKKTVVVFQKDMKHLKNLVKDLEKSETLDDEDREILKGSHYDTLQQLLAMTKRCIRLERKVTIYYRQVVALTTQINFMRPTLIEYGHADVGYFYIRMVRPKYIGFVLSHFYKPGVTGDMKQRMSKYGPGTMEQQLISYFAISSPISLRELDKSVKSNLADFALVDTNENVKLSFAAIVSTITSMIMLAENKHGIRVSNYKYIPVNLDLIKIDEWHFDLREESEVELDPKLES